MDSSMRLPGLSLGLATSLGLTSGAGGGVPRYRWFDGILHELLLGADEAPLMGADGYYLYGVA